MGEQRFSLMVDSPTGHLALSATAEALTHLTWLDNGESIEDNPNGLLEDAAAQLQAYFRSGTNNPAPFDVPVSFSGTTFQNRGWQAMAEIPFGRTESYGELATRIGSGPRAVGMLCATNPIPVIVPCHRVLASGGKLGGFSGGKGLPTKEWLLRHEGVLEPALI